MSSLILISVVQGLFLHKHLAQWDADLGGAFGRYCNTQQLFHCVALQCPAGLVRAHNSNNKQRPLSVWGKPGTPVVVSALRDSS